MKKQLIKCLGISIVFALMIGFLSTHTVEAHSIENKLSIPSIDIEAPVGTAYLRQFDNGAVTWDMAPFRWRAAHLQGTPWFGQPGNVVIGGHSEITPGEADIFYHLNNVKVGDDIIFHGVDQDLQYKIVEVKEVNYRDISVLNPKYGEQLTLITCDTKSYHAQSGTYLRRLVVIATPIS